MRNVILILYYSSKHNDILFLYLEALASLGPGVPRSQSVSQSVSLIFDKSYDYYELEGLDESRVTQMVCKVMQSHAKSYKVIQSHPKSSKVSMASPYLYISHIGSLRHTMTPIAPMGPCYSLWLLKIPYDSLY